MVSTLAPSNIFLNKLETNCVELIEHELTNFFNGCSKSSSAYSFMVGQNLKNHSTVNFEKTVLNYDELMALMEDIVYKLNNSLNGCSTIYEEDMKHEFDEKLICLNTLNNTVIQSKTTHNITIFCENGIDKAILKSLSLFHSGLISDYLLNKVNFGTLILGKNNSKNLTEKHEKEIYNQIQGILMNIKIDLRNMMVKNVMEQINGNLYADMTA